MTEAEKGMLKMVFEQMTKDPTCKFSLNRGQKQITVPGVGVDPATFQKMEAEFMPTKGATLVITVHGGAKNEGAPLMHEEK